MNLEEDDKKKYLLLVTLIGALFVMIFIAIIIFIWTRPINNVEKISTSESKLGTYSNATFSLEEQTKVYSDSISALLTSNDSDELFEMLNSEFKKFNSFDKEKFKTYISNKKLFSKNLKLKEYKSTGFKNNTVIKLLYETNDSDNINFIVNVFEKSPNDYTISFDNLISYIDEDKNYESNGLKITLSNQTLFSNEYRANIKITNISGSDVILNKQKSAEIIYLNQGENLNTVVSNNIFMGQPFALQPNQSITYPIRFLISEFSFNSIKKLIIKDVTNENTNNTQDIEINISEN